MLISIIQVSFTSSHLHLKNKKYISYIFLIYIKMSTDNTCNKECNRTDINNLAVSSVSYAAIQYIIKKLKYAKHSKNEILMRTGVFALVSYIYDNMANPPSWDNKPLEGALSMCSKCIARDSIIVVVELLRDFLMKGQVLPGAEFIIAEIIAVFGADFSEKLINDKMKKKMS